MLDFIGFFLTVFVALVIGAVAMVVSAFDAWGEIRRLREEAGKLAVLVDELEVVVGDQCGRLDELEAEIKETDDIAGHNSDLADAVANRLDDAESRLDAQRDFIFDIRDRLNVVEDVAAGRVVPTEKAK